MRGWAAGYDLHFAFTRAVVPSDLVAVSDYASALDLGSVYVPGGIAQFRSNASKLESVVSTVVGSPPQLQHLLLLGDAVGHGGDSFPPALSAGQAVQVEWITGERGRGVNGRTYFPYLGSSVHDVTWIDIMAPETAQAIEVACNSWASFVSLETGGELVVKAGLRGGAPVSPLTSRKVIGVTVRRSTFTHQRRRVEWRTPFDATP